MSQMIIDVREPSEFENGHVEGAINVPPTEIMNGAVQLKDVPKDTKLVLYCHTGSRSAVAANILQSQGFTNIINGINKDHVNAKYIV